MKLNPLLIGLSLAAGFMTGASAQTVLKIGYATTLTSHYGVGTTVFCDDIEKGTQGRYKCQQFPNSALGGAPLGVDPPHRVLQPEALDLVLLVTHESYPTTYRTSSSVSAS